MAKLLGLITIVLFNYMTINAQRKAEYFINITDSGQYLVYGTRLLINFPKNACYEKIEFYSLRKGNKFIIMQILDEMENRRGILIFDKKGNQINYDKVQIERAKYYKPYNCCVYVQELNGKLYFWDVIDPDGKEYDCYYDSQTNAYLYLIPRYYIFNPKKDNVETKIIKNKCTQLIQNGKIICD